VFAAALSRKTWKRFSGYLLSYIFLIFWGILSALVNCNIWGNVSLFTIIEVRNLVRFPAFLISCVTFLDRQYYEKIFRFLTVIFYVNFPFILYQYFTYHPTGVWTRGDYLNGLFGLTVGGNTFVNVLMICVVAYWFNKWINKECHIWKMLLPICLSILIAALIELKSFFVEIVILYGWYLMSQKKSLKDILKNIFLIVTLLLVAQYCLQIMYQEYPWFKQVMSFSGLLELTSESGGYTSSGDLNRFTGVLTIASKIFHGELSEILFGVGLGNGAVYGLNGTFTKFYLEYRQLNYSWFSSTYMFVQLGLVGLSVYIFSFCLLFFKKKNKQFSLLSQFTILLVLFLVIYNETLKTDAAYLIYFCISSGFIKDIQHQNKPIIND
jgi:hypothetical protein